MRESTIQNYLDLDMRLVHIYSIKLNNASMSLSCILIEFIRKSPFDKTDNNYLLLGFLT